MGNRHRPRWVALTGTTESFEKGAGHAWSVLFDQTSTMNLGLIFHGQGEYDRVFVMFIEQILQRAASKAINMRLGTRLIEHNPWPAKYSCAINRQA